MAADFNKFNVEMILSGNQREIKLLYNEMNDWLMHKTSNNEELKNDIFMKILNNLSKFDKKRSKLHNFIYTITQNEILDNIRAKKRCKDNIINNILGNHININRELNQNDEQQLDWLYYNHKNYPIYEMNFDEIPTEREIKINIIYQQLSIPDAQFVVEYLFNKKSKPMSERKKYLKIIKQIKKNI